MIRLRYATIRFLILLAIVAAVVLCAGPLVRFGTVVALQRVIGARVDIASTDVALWPPRIAYSDVRIADPSKEREDAVRVERAELSLDGPALLRRKYEIAHAQLHGVEFSVERSETGQLEKTAESAGGSSFDLTPHVERLARLMQRAATLKAETAVESLQTVQTGRRIETAWKERFEDIAGRAERLEANFRELKSTVREIDNPLRDLPRVEKTLRGVDQLRGQLIAIRGEAEQLPTTIQLDLESLDRARLQDQQRVAALGQQLTGSDEALQLGPELVGNLLAEKLRMLRHYADVADRAARLTVIAPEATRSRGQDFDLGDRASDDAWRVHRCELNGILRHNGDRYSLTGIIDNLASGGRSNKHDGRIRLMLEGATTARIDYRRPSRVSNSDDLLTLHVPRIEVSAQSFGSADTLQLHAGPSQLELWVKVAPHNGEIEGEIFARQRMSSLDIAVGGNDAIVREIESSLQESLARIDIVETRARVSGPLLQPRIRDIDTNLTRTLADAVTRAKNRAIIATKQAAGRAIDEAYASNRQRVEQVLAGHHQQLIGEIDAIDQRIGQAQQEMLARLKLPPGSLQQLGRAFGGLRR